MSLMRGISKSLPARWKIGASGSAMSSRIDACTPRRNRSTTSGFVSAVSRVQNSTNPGRLHDGIDVEIFERLAHALQGDGEREVADEAVEASLADELDLAGAVAGDDDVGVGLGEAGLDHRHLHQQLGQAADRQHADRLALEVGTRPHRLFLEAHDLKADPLGDGREAVKRRLALATARMKSMLAM